MQTLNHCFFCHQKLQKFDICVYGKPSAPASATSLAAVSATSVAVNAAIAAVAAAATAVVSVTATIAISAAAIAATLWLIVVCPHRCLCFRLPLPLPAPAVAAVVCWHHGHCCRRYNRFPCSFHCHRRHRCLFSAAGSAAASLFPPPLPLFPLPPHTTASLSIAAAPPFLFPM
jgi:hypothetical protein